MNVLSHPESFFMSINGFGAFLLVIALLACSGKKEKSYVDLRSGQKITVEKDEATGYMINPETKKNVYLYVDPENRDTFYGRTGKIVNNKISRSDNGLFIYSGDDEYVYENGDYKLKIGEDGDVKLKDGDSKLKVEADGDKKVKRDDYKKKVSEDGDVKIKSGDTKIEIKDGKKTVKRDD
jgi:hypothetical protein